MAIPISVLESTNVDLLSLTQWGYLMPDFSYFFDDENNSYKGKDVCIYLLSQLCKVERKVI